MSKTPERIWIWKPNLSDGSNFVEVRWGKVKGFQEYRLVKKKAKKARKAK